MNMQTLLAVAFSALFHTPKGSHSWGMFADMIHLKIGKQAAKAELDYLESEPRCGSMHSDDPSDSSETRKICEKWWGYRRKRRGGVADEPRASGDEEPGRSDRRRRRAAAPSVADTTEFREDSEGGASAILQQPASNPVVLTPNNWEDRPTHVAFALS